MAYYESETFRVPATQEFIDWCQYKETVLAKSVRKSVDMMVKEQKTYDPGWGALVAWSLGRGSYYPGMTREAYFRE